MQNYYIRKWENPILRKKCSVVKDFSNLDDLISSMNSLLGFFDSGISAPQVGDNRKVILAKINFQRKLFVNPKIKSSKGYVPLIEGCISFPGIIVPTIRRYSIDLEYQDEKGNKKRFIRDGRRD